MDSNTITKINYTKYIMTYEIIEFEIIGINKSFKINISLVNIDQEDQNDVKELLGYYVCKSVGVQYINPKPNNHLFTKKYMNYIKKMVKQQVKQQMK